MNDKIIVLTDLTYMLCFATVKYNELYGYSPRNNMEVEIVIARDWDVLEEFEDEDIYNAVIKKFNSDRIDIYEIDIKHIIDGKEYISEIDCTKFR